MYATSGAAGLVVGERRRCFTANLVRDFNFTASRHYDVLNGKTVDGQHRISVMTKWMSSSQASADPRAWRDAPSTSTRDGSDRSAARRSSSPRSQPASRWSRRVSSGSRAGAARSPTTASRTSWDTSGSTAWTATTRRPTRSSTRRRPTSWRARSWASCAASQCARDRLDLSIYRYQGTCYYETIYIQGSLFLDHVRQQLGNEGVLGDAAPRSGAIIAGP